MTAEVHDIHKDRIVLTKQEADDICAANLSLRSIVELLHEDLSCEDETNYQPISDNIKEGLYIAMEQLLDKMPVKY